MLHPVIAHANLDKTNFEPDSGNVEEFEVLFLADRVEVEVDGSARVGLVQGAEAPPRRHQLQRVAGLEDDQEILM